jgi:NAD(P)-dependent dehydrogenase (short-subunit alcohol dehydrogenase family)
MHIAEKTVLITGANRGIGKALVKEALSFEMAASPTA